MASEGSADERNELVVSVASMLFGTTIPAQKLVTETPERVTEGGLPSREELRQALEGSPLAVLMTVTNLQGRLACPQTTGDGDDPWMVSHGETRACCS